MSEKTCIKCLLLKPLSEFSKDKTRPDGHFPYCKVCKKISNAECNLDREKARARGRKYGRSLKDRPEKSEIVERRKSYHREYHAKRQSVDETYRQQAIERARKHYKDTPREHHTAINRKWRAENAEYSKQRARELHLLTTYGLSIDDYNAMLESQGGACAICRRKPEQVKSKVSVLVVDHCHSSGKVRALLCYTCNYGLGQFADNPDLLKAATAYIEAHK